MRSGKVPERFHLSHLHILQDVLHLYLLESILRGTKESRGGAIQAAQQRRTWSESRAARTILPIVLQRNRKRKIALAQKAKAGERQFLPQRRSNCTRESAGPGGRACRTRYSPPTSLNSKGS